METMTGVILPGNRQTELRDVSCAGTGTRSGPGADESILHLRQRSQGHLSPHGSRNRAEVDRSIAGHEPCGMIDRVGPGVHDFARWRSRRDLPFAGGGNCSDCRSGWMISCSEPERAAYGWQRDGGHAKFSWPSNVRWFDCRMNCHTLMEPWWRADSARHMPPASGPMFRGRDPVLITGLGPVGVGTALLCRAMGASVIGGRRSLSDEPLRRARVRTDCVTG